MPSWFAICANGDFGVHLIFTMDMHMGLVIREAVADVYSELGPGLGESLYQNALAIALRKRGHLVETEVVIPIPYRGVYVGFMRPDLVVDKELVLELKATTKIADTHVTQTRAYLRWLPPPPPGHERLKTVMRGAVINFGRDIAEVLPVEVPVVTQVD